MSFYDICKYCKHNIDSDVCELKTSITTCNGELFEGIDVLNTTIDVLMKIFGGDEPCNFNGWDEYADCDFCEKNCDNHNASSCWRNALHEEWYNNERQDY